MKTAMITHTGIKDVDTLLHPYLQEENEELSRHLLTQLIAEEIDPIVRRVIVYRLGNVTPKIRDQQVQDLHGEVIVRLLTKLRDVKNGTSTSAIKDFRNYAAVIAHNVCSEQSRRQNFYYSRLKDHIRYALINQPEFALWEDGQGQWLAGFGIWREQGLGAASTLLRQSPEEFVGSRLGGAQAQRMGIAEQLSLIFNEAGRPIEFTRLIKIVAALRGIDIRNVSNEHVAAETDTLVETSSQQSTGSASEIEQRLYLQKLWREICKLPLPHRTALLLNLRDRGSDDRGLIISLADLKIATMKQIAEALALSPERFAAIWIDLPWDDIRIAQHLETTRQTIINLRKTARKLLARRMKELTGTS